MFGNPPCPTCGGRFLVTRIRTGDSYFGQLPGNHYRCWRCFHAFNTDDGSQGEQNQTPRSIDGDRTVRIADVHVEVSKAGAKYAVDTFQLSLENEHESDIDVNRIMLRFAEGMERVIPLSESVEARGTRDIDIGLNWIYPGQDQVTIEVHAPRGVLATATKKLPLRDTTKRSGTRRCTAQGCEREVGRDRKFCRIHRLMYGY